MDKIATKLSIIEERRVRLARLTAAMADGSPPALSPPGFHLYAEEKLFAIRPMRRLEYLGPSSDAPTTAFASWGRPLFRPDSSGGSIYISPATDETPAPLSAEWREVGRGRLYLTNFRLACAGQRGDWLEFPFDAISWSGCYSMGIGLKTGNWPPMGLQTAYPEWIYAFYKFLADQEVSKVQLTSALDQRAQKMGI